LVWFGLSGASTFIRIPSAPPLLFSEGKCMEVAE